MTDLTEIGGVGPSYAEDLQEAGYDSAEDVADANGEEIDTIIDTGDGAEIVSNAQDEVTVGDDVDVVEEEADEEDADDNPDTSEYYTFEPGFSDEQEHHLIAALVNEEVNARRRNNAGRLAATQEAIRSVREGEPYEFTLEQLTVAYTATNQLQSEYRGTRGLSNFVSNVREVSQFFQTARQDHWPDNE